jgi:hypothetical protein
MKVPEKIICLDGKNLKDAPLEISRQLGVKLNEVIDFQEILYKKIRKLEGYIDFDLNPPLDFPR